MKRYFFALACLLSFSYAIAQPASKKGETEDFRRSSLCLLLVTDQGDEYAKAIQEQFVAMPMPARYNSLNTDVRVLSISKTATEKRVTQVLEDQQIAKQLIGKWFNRDYQGRMNMNRIHEWGGYNATFADVKRAENTVRGKAMLTDEGEELIKNTFVMVCDISYYDRKNTGILLAALAASLGSVASQMTNDYQLKQQYQNLGSTVAEASLDMAGFSVNIISYLYRLDWNDKLRDKLYSQYWVDDTMPVAEQNQRKGMFDSDRNSFKLDFIGQYRSTAGRTVSDSSTPDLKAVIREVCSNAVDKSINSLAKMFPVFKAKTPFYCENGQLYAYIGTKEGMTSKSKYEVIEAVKTEKKGIQYNKVGEVRPSYVWDNKGVFMTADSIELLYKGSQFRRTSGRKDICDQGLMLREKGRLGYQYKRNQLYVGLVGGINSISEEKLKKRADDAAKLYECRSAEMSGVEIGAEVGWLINYHTNFAWEPLEFSMIFGSADQIGLKTGVVLRTNPLGKNGRYSLFVWPSGGFGYTFGSVDYEGTIKYRQSGYKDPFLNGYYTRQEEGSVFCSSFHLTWGIKVGINLTENWLIALNKSDLLTGVTIGFNY